MLHMIVLGLCGLLIAAALAGFFLSFWRAETARPE